MTTKSGNLGLGSLEKWDIATTKKFLKLYRSYRCLWDHTDAAYKDKAERQNALESIAAAMSIDGFDSRYVVLKVRALRSTYLYERRKVRLRIKNGEKFQTHLGWFHLADSFLRNYVVEKSYLDPNKDLPPPVESSGYENTTNTGEISNACFPKDESSQYNLYECPKSQMTNYGDDDDDDEDADVDEQELQLHILEVQQSTTQQQQPPQQQQLHEIQIKTPVKQTRAVTRKSDSKKSDHIPFKRIKIDSEISSTPVSDETMYSSEDHVSQPQQHQQQQQQQHQQQNQITYMIQSNQPSTSVTSLSVTDSNIKPDINATFDSPSVSTSTTLMQSDTQQVQGVVQSSLHKTTTTMDDDEDEFDAFAKSVAMQLRKIPKADAYSLQVQFQLLLSQAKLKAMGSKSIISLDLSGFFGK